MNQTDTPYRVKVINLGLRPEELSKFNSKLNNLNVWNRQKRNIKQIDYREINPTEIADSCDALVLSPGNAPVGLLTPERTATHPQMGNLYTLIHTAVQEGIPLIGVNAGHEAINCAYGWAIEELSTENTPDDEKTQYQTESQIDMNGVTDIIAKQINDITIKLTNEWAVLPKAEQKKRFGQNRVTQLVDHNGYPLISKVDSPALVYGVQFDITDGTKPIFENFFEFCRSIRRE